MVDECVYSPEVLYVILQPRYPHVHYSKIREAINFAKVR